MPRNRDLLLWATWIMILPPVVSQDDTCRCSMNQTDGLTGCCLNEDHFLGLCYKKCMDLTHGQFPYRTASNTCCNSPIWTDCLSFMNSVSSGWGCYGYGIGLEGGCADLPCSRTEKTLKYAGNSVVGRWLFGLTFNIPKVAEWGPLSLIDGGNCTHMNIGSMEATEFELSGGVPEVAYRISDIGLQCRILASSGTLAINFGFASSKIYLRLAVQPLDLQDSLEEDSLGKLPLGLVSITNCSVDARLSYLDFGGTSGFAPSLKSFREAIITAVRKDAGPLACGRLQPLVAEQATSMLSSLAQKLKPLLTTQETLAPVEPKSQEALVNWAQYPPVLLLQALLAERRNVTADISKRLPIMDIAVGQSFASIAGDVAANITVDSVRVEGLETFNPSAMQVRGIRDNIHLEVAFRRVRFTISTQIRIESAPKAVYFAEHKPLQKKVNVSIELGNASLAFRMLAMVSKSALNNLGVDQMQQLGCLASCARIGAIPPGTPISIERASVNATPELRLVMVGGMETGVADAFDTTVSTLLRSNLKAVEALVPGGVQMLRPRIDAAVGQYMDQMPACKPSTVYMGPGPVVKNMLVGLSAVLGLSAIPLAMCMLRHPEVTPVEALLVEDTEKPLFRHRVVPSAGRILSMNLLLSATLLFIYADLGVGTVINLLIEGHGEAVSVGPAFAFSMGGVIRDSFKAGAYLFAFVVAFLSGAWPLLKLMLMAVAWIAPPNMLSVRRRDKLLRFLDEYGKYSLIDSWLTILALESYKIKWHSSNADISVMVQPVPMMAFFAFALASVLSLIMGHITSEFHKNAASWDVGHKDGNGVEDYGADWDCLSEVEALSDHSPRGDTWILTASLVLTAGVIIAGAFANSFAVTTSGVLSTLILDPVAQTRRYSLMSLGMAVTNEKVVDTGSRMVQVIFFAFTLVIPMMLMVVLIVLWVVPLRLRAQRKMLTFCHFLDAWAAFDVFALAVVVAKVQFGQMASFLVYHDNVAHLCGWVRDNLQSECFHIECEFTTGFYTLAAAGMVSYIVPKTAFCMCEAALHERGGADGMLSGDDGCCKTGDYSSEDELCSNSSASCSSPLATQF